MFREFLNWRMQGDTETSPTETKISAMTDPYKFISTNPRMKAKEVKEIADSYFNESTVKSISIELGLMMNYMYKRRDYLSLQRSLHPSDQGIRNEHNEIEKLLSNLEGKLPMSHFV